MEKWKEGDIAICVNISPMDPISTGVPPLRLNSEYIVQNVYQCPKCKTISLDVGIGSINGTKCLCQENIPCNNIRWCSSKRFVKKNIKSKEEQIEEAIKKEDYELAEQLIKT